MAQAIAFQLKSANDGLSCCQTLLGHYFNHFAMQNPHMPANRHNTLIFWADFRWLLLAIVFGMGMGWLFGYVAWGITAGLLTYFAFRMVMMRRFLYWINQNTLQEPSNLSGSLSYVAYQLYHSREQGHLTHQRMTALVKKIRNSLLALSDSVIVLDKNDRLEWWNQSADKLLNLTPSDQGRHVFAIITPAKFAEYYQNAMTPNLMPANDGIRLQSWINPERHLQCELTLFGEEKLLIIYDVTRLQHLEQMRKDFVANVSHELRTPLTVLMGYIETFSDQPDIDPKWQRGFSLMGQQTKRMNSIINDLLMLSRLENEEYFEIKCVNMPQLLTQVFDDAQVYNKEHAHLIDLHLDSQLNVKGSEMYLTSALLNLVTNAIKYTPKGGEIAIAWTQVKNGCLLTVSDNGIGIAPEHIERLTERFYRVDSGRSRATGGTGLGLAIVKHILYQHQATLKIESTKGQGSTFKVLFPTDRLC